jgi:general secretion pathway protein I
LLVVEAVRKNIFGSLAQYCSEGRGEDGFTLIEVIAALAILSLSLGLLFSSLSESFYHQGRAKTLSEATMLAQTVLARAGTELPLKPGESGGMLKDGYRWTMRISPYGSPADQQEWPVAAYRISVAVFSNETPQDPVVTLTTMRLAAKGSAQ